MFLNSTLQQPVSQTAVQLRGPSNEHSTSKYEKDAKGRVRKNVKCDAVG